MHRGGLGWINSGEDVNALPDEETYEDRRGAPYKQYAQPRESREGVRKASRRARCKARGFSDYAELLGAALGHEYRSLTASALDKTTNSRAMPQASSRLGRACTTSTGPAIARNTDVGTMHFDEPTAATSMPELDELVQQVIAENTDDFR